MTAVGQRHSEEFSAIMITDLIQKMIERVDLTEQEARGAMEEIMAGQATMRRLPASSRPFE
jgi:anthranilate phosphoribosyltransferase